MAWEQRARGGRYYVRSVRSGGRVGKEYLGGGPVAELAAAWDVERREWREAQRQREAQEAALADAVGHPVTAFCAAVEVVAREALTVAGYHRPKRGPWRKCMTQPANAGPLLPKEELLALLRRAENGDQAALQQARTVADECPKVWERLGNIATTARDHLIDAISANPLQREAMERKFQEVRAALAGPDPSLLELALAERAAVCWLQTYHEDYQDTALRQQAGVSLSRLEMQHKRGERAQRRYLAAVKALAQVQKLKIPAIQVNVATHGGQQVNVGNLDRAISG